MNLKGIQYLHEPTNFTITGLVDDIWVRLDGELIVVTIEVEVEYVLEKIRHHDLGSICRWQENFMRIQ